MEEMLNKFIKEGKREHEEMETFIREFRTTNELLLKERNNLLSKLRIEVHRLSRVMNDVLILKNEVKGVTTRGGRTTTRIAYNNEINNINKEPSELPHDKPEELRDTILRNDPQKTKNNFSTHNRGRPFLATAQAMIDVSNKKITLRVGDDEDNFKPVIQPQRRLNPKVQDVVKNEILKLLDSRLIYPISDNSWVSPIHVVPKKGGMTVVLNGNIELIPSVFQIPIAPEDQEKMTFTCLYGTFSYRRMPFGLCNAPATFQRCMTKIFHDMVEDFMEVFMDDFSVFGNSFDSCFVNLDRMLTRCKETNLVLNWEKCHFMVREGIVLGHKISRSRIEVDKAKTDVIAKLPYPTNVKGARAKLNDGEPWYADYINYIVGKDEPYAFILCAYNTMRRWVAGSEILEILAHCHFGPTGGHRSASVTGRKVYEAEFFWPNTLKDAKDYVMRCDACKRSGNISSRSEMPQNNIQVCEVFDVWGLDFMGPFPNSRDNTYILVVVDYVSKWVEAQALPTNDARVVVRFLRGLFARFEVPKALISDMGTYFCNSQLENALEKYGVTHRLSTVYVTPPNWVAVE
ncbi:reverse transcriptase domain-containing protein [Tanacetum coccineum]